MGTDIHPRIEVKRDGRWIDITGDLDTRWESGCWENPRPWNHLDNRNYTLFSVLANVRNGYGFAGVDRGDPLPPISDNRGIPKDSPWFNDPDEQWNLGDHSFTWVTLKELLDYNWGRELVARGVVSEQEYTGMREEKRNPRGWCGGVSGANNITVGSEKMDSIISGAEPRDSSKTYNISAEWREDLIGRVRGFVESTIPWLAGLTDSPEDLRIVMGFDS